MLEDVVTSAFLLVFTTVVDEAIEEATFDICEVADSEVVEIEVETVEIVDETGGVVGFSGGSHFTLKFPLSPPKIT